MRPLPRPEARISIAMRISPLSSEPVYLTAQSPQLLRCFVDILKGQCPHLCLPPRFPTCGAAGTITVAVRAPCPRPRPVVSAGPSPLPPRQVANPFPSSRLRGCQAGESAYWSPRIPKLASFSLPRPERPYSD